MTQRDRWKASRAPEQATTERVMLLGVALFWLARPAAASAGAFTIGGHLGRGGSRVADGSTASYAAP